MTIKAKPMLCLFNKLLNHLFLILISNCGPRFAY
jgi:hypothetical protein